MDERGRSVEGTDLLLVGTAEWIERLGRAIASRDGNARIVRTRERALEVNRNATLDCVLVGTDGADGTGVDLVEALRAETATLPVVLATATGSEATASDAIAAGVTDYLPIADPTAPAVEPLLERIGGAIRRGHRHRTERTRARQFDAVFHDARTATWVLDPEGTLERVNRTAREMVDAGAAALVGRPFWTLPWWNGDERVTRDVRQVVRRAAEMGNSQQVIIPAAVGGEERRIELSVHPVENPHGRVIAIVVDGDDVTERVSLHRELRRSERLHRVTLNNMTDTVLVTDESGVFTYICPNVHFIFGYSAEEIRELGSIRELLGEELIDEAALEAEGVLTNIECEATDKSGRTHTLLVNVRQVDIQGGTRLYSCRDITMRKQREEAVRTLHTTTRNLLYAETADEIARTIVEDTPDVLDLNAAAIYLFRDGRTVLEPAAYTDAMAEGHGPLESHSPGDGTLVGHSFIENERHFFADIRRTGQLANEGTDLRSLAVIPLGEHGVYVVGAVEQGAFDSLRRELADLVAATAEAALDRVERETRLREQDRALQRQNEQLTALNEMNELVRGIDRALVRAETREEIDHAVCETLTDAERISFAWIGEVDEVAGTVSPQAWAGNEDGYLDSVDLSLDSSDEPAVRAAREGSGAMVSNAAADLQAAPWRKAAISRDCQSVVSVPLADDEFTHGVLAVYASAPGAIDDLAPVLAELGETVTAAITGLERKDALLSTSVTRLEFETDDPTFSLLELARRAGCTLTLAGVVRQTDEAVSTVATVGDCEEGALEVAASEIVGVDEISPLSGDGTDGVVQLSLSRPFIALPLADHGAVLQSIEVDGERATIAVDVPEGTAARKVSQFVGAAFEDVELVAKRTEERTPSRALYSTFLDRLTERQLEVLRAAYFGGYFESPRNTSGADLAEALDVSPPAVYRHLRTVERKLFTTLFDDVGVQVDTTA